MVFNTDALPGHDAGAVSSGGPAKAKAVCEEKGFGGGEGRRKSNGKTCKNGGFVRFQWNNYANCGLISKNI